jgi:hypothetical protein
MTSKSSFNLKGHLTISCKWALVWTSKTWEREVCIIWRLSMPKRDGRPFTGVSTIFDREPHYDRLAYERASLLNMNDISDI